MFDKDESLSVVYSTTLPLMLTKQYTSCNRLIELSGTSYYCIIVLCVLLHCIQYSDNCNDFQFRYYSLSTQYNILSSYSTFRRTRLPISVHILQYILCDCNGLESLVISLHGANTFASLILKSYCLRIWWLVIAWYRELGGMDLHIGQLSHSFYRTKIK